MLPYVLAGGALLAAYLLGRRSYRPAAPSFAGSSNELSRTKVVPHLGCPFPAGHNAIWCISLDLAWKKAMDEVFKGPIQLLEQPAEADLLNETTPSVHGLPAEAFQAEVQCLQNDDKFEVYRISSSFSLSFPFQLAYRQNRQPLLFNGSVRVKSFGLPRGSDPPPELARQPTVLYAREGEFIVDPCRHSGPFQMILASIGREESLLATLEKSERLCAGHKPMHISCDRLLIPEQNWDLTHPFAQLSGEIHRPPYGGEIGVAQRSQFRLDRNGAELRSQVSFYAIFAKKGESREYRFDQPFLLYLKARESGQVVFAQWVDNEELLVPFGT